MRFLWLLVLVAQPVFGQTGQAILTCAPPTQYTDGAPIGSASISYKFYRGTTIGTYPTSQLATNCGTIFTGLAPGMHYFVATAIVGGQESAFSTATSKLITATAPNPPGIALKSLAGPVFAVQTTDNSIVLPQIGTVVAGRDCDASQMISQNGNTYARIDLSRVTLLPGMSAAGLAVFGVCQ